MRITLTLCLQRVSLWLLTTTHGLVYGRVGILCLCAVRVCRVFPPCPCVSGSRPISGLLSGMLQKAAGSNTSALMKPRPWLIGDTVAWGNERGSNQTGGMRGQSGPHTTELSLSCSFVEHTGGEDTYTLLIKILQMQTSFLTRDGSGNLVTTFSTRQLFFFNLLPFIIPCQVFHSGCYFRRVKFGRNEP